MSLIRNQVLFSLVIAAAVAVALSGFVGYAPNRLVSGRPVSLWAAAGFPTTFAILVIGMLLFTTCFASPSRPLHSAEAGLAVALLLLTLAAAGQAASTLASGARPAGRISLGAAFWVLSSCAALAIADALQRLDAGPTLRVLAVAGVGAGAIALAAAGVFDGL